MHKFVRTKSHAGSKFSKIFFEQLYTGWTVVKGQALNPARPVPAWPTSLRTVPARPKIRPGHEDVKSRRRLIKDDRRRLLHNYVGVRRRPEHALSNPATTYGNRAF